MSVSRRRFLRSGALVSAALLLKSGTTAFGSTSTFRNAGDDATATNDPARFYSREMFEPYIGDTFRVHVGKQTVDLKLVALDQVAPAKRGPATRKTARTDCFSMRFHAVKQLSATAGSRQLQHAKLGAFELFTTQSTNGSSFVHTAIVNHLI